MDARDPAPRPSDRPDVLRRTASRLPDAPALIRSSPDGTGPGRVWTYVELDGWVDGIAGSLARCGVGGGDVVAMRLPAAPEAVALVHAVWRRGGTLLPLHPRWTESEVAEGLAVTGPAAIRFEAIEDVPADRESAAFGPTRSEPESGRGPGTMDGRSGPGVLAAPVAHADGPAAIVLTSGSTGAPRPIPLSHGNLLASARAAADRLSLTPQDRWLASLALAHVGGLALVHRAAWVGSGLVTGGAFDAEGVAARIRAGQITHASLVPVMLARLMEAFGRRPLPETLRLLLIGGAAAGRPLLDRSLERGYPLALTYGLTEASSQVATAPPRLVRRKPGTVGPPLQGVSVRIREPDGAGRGEILVKGPTVVSLPERPGTVVLDEDGWLRTGDLGRLDEDGHLWVTGRRSDRIVTGGVTVEPSEVERVLQDHPAVGEVAVVGLPDPEWGERIVAVVVPASSASRPTLESLVEHVGDRLGPAKRPRELRLVDALPRNANGKVDRARLRSL